MEYEHKHNINKFKSNLDIIKKKEIECDFNIPNFSNKENLQPLLEKCYKCGSTENLHLDVLPDYFADKSSLILTSVAIKGKLCEQCFRKQNLLNVMF